jgi:hypothetical protein
MNSNVGEEQQVEVSLDHFRSHTEGCEAETRHVSIGVTPAGPVPIGVRDSTLAAPARTRWHDHRRGGHRASS